MIFKVSSHSKFYDSIKLLIYFELRVSFMIKVLGGRDSTQYFYSQSVLIFMLRHLKLL